jgi:hypothetical protein
MDSNDASSNTNAVQFHHSPAGSGSHANSSNPPIIELDLLEEVKSPFETAAEAAILQAIEEADKKRALQTVAGAKDRDGILHQVPSESLHLFGEDLLEQDEAPPPVFSLKSIDKDSGKRASFDLSKFSAGSRFSKAVGKVQMVNAMANRSRIGSMESGEASLTYHGKHNRVPSKIPATPPKTTEFVELMQPIEPTRSAPELFDIVNRMGEMTKQTTMRNLHKSEYSEVPTAGAPMHEIGENDVDPESLRLDRQEDEECANQNHIAQTKRKRDSNRATLIRRCCLPLIGFKNWLKAQKKAIRKQVKVALFLLTPLVSMAFILYYLAGNPTGPYGATYSWWCLFVARLGVTSTLAKAQQYILIDYIALETSFYIRTFGRIFTLMLIQSKGWPCLVFFWGQWNFTLTYGNGAFARHWLFWLGDNIEIFGDNNDSNGIQANSTYAKILVVIMCVGVLIAVKRLLVALLIGKKKYGKYPTSWTIECN